LFLPDLKAIIKESLKDVNDVYLCKFDDSEEVKFILVERKHFETFNEI